MVEPKIFSITKKSIKDSLVKLESDREEAIETKKKSGHNQSGDMMDDPLLHQEMERIGQLEAKIRAHKSYLHCNLHSLPQSKGDGVLVRIGCKATIKITYAKGFEEKIDVTLGSDIDYKFLSKMRDLFDGETKIIISPDSALGKQLLHKKTNSSFSYESPLGRNRVKILNISPSSLLTGNSVI